MYFSFVPLITALLPAIGIHVSYLLAAQFGHVPWCFPYIDSCTSISAVGREGPESYIFRAAIIPTAIFMMVYWRLSCEWLRTLGSHKTNRNRVMWYLGLAASIGLILYATVLGSIGEEFRVQRRIGVTIFYICTFMAQVLMTGQLAALVKSQPSVIPVRTSRLLTWICGTVALLGLTSLSLWAFYDGHNRIDDAFEWVLTLLLQLHIFVTYFAWRDSGFRASFTVSGRRDAATH
jgi:hypothetical protein